MNVSIEWLWRIHDLESRQDWRAVVITLDNQPIMAINASGLLPFRDTAEFAMALQRALQERVNWREEEGLFYTEENEEPPDDVYTNISKELDLWDDWFEEENNAAED